MPDWLEVQDRRGRNVLINLGNVLKIEGDGKLTASINLHRWLDAVMRA
jgi:hypothetical protein